MPTYEYRCLDCQHQYEKREGYEAPALQECPTCGGTARRVLQATAVVFKGSGFYKTDSREPALSEAEGSAPAKSAPEAESAAADRSAAKVEPSGDGSSKDETSKGDPSKTESAPTADKAAAADRPSKDSPAETAAAS